MYTGGETKNGGMITSCICHGAHDAMPVLRSQCVTGRFVSGSVSSGCPWGTLSVEGKTSYQVGLAASILK